MPRGARRGEADDMNWFFPEGRVFSYGFYGFSLVNVATATPRDAEFRARAISELERIIPKWILPRVCESALPMASSVLLLKGRFPARAPQG